MTPVRITQSRRRERRSYRWLSNGRISSCGMRHSDVGARLCTAILRRAATLGRYGAACDHCRHDHRHTNNTVGVYRAIAPPGAALLPSYSDRVMVRVKGSSGTRRLFQYMPGQSLAKKYSWRSDEPVTDGGAIQSRCWPMGNAWSRAWPTVPHSRKKGFHGGRFLACNRNPCHPSGPQMMNPSFHFPVASKR